MTSEVAGLRSVSSGAPASSDHNEPIFSTHPGGDHSWLSDTQDLQSEAQTSVWSNMASSQTRSSVFFSLTYLRRRHFPFLPQLQRLW